MMRRLLLAATAALLLPVGAAWADAFEDGVAAERRGDGAEAVRLYRLAAEQGIAAARYVLGLMYASGHGVPRDYAEAIRWLRLAAAQEYGNAQYVLGLMYASGLGVPQDYVRARMWFNIAVAAGGVPNAATYRDMIAKVMTPEQIAEAQKLARECLQRNLKNCD